MIKAKTIEMKVSDMPFYHRQGAKNGNTYISLGNVKRGGNEPYCYPEEKRCAGRICRVLSPEKTIYKATVINEDGTVWQIDLRNFESWELIKITDRSYL